MDTSENATSLRQGTEVLWQRLEIHGANLQGHGWKIARLERHLRHFSGPLEYQRKVPDATNDTPLAKSCGAIGNNG